MAAKTKYNNTAKNCSTFFTLALAYCLIFFGSFSCWFEQCVPKKKKKDAQVHDSRCSQCSRFHFFFFNLSSCTIT